MNKRKFLVMLIIGIGAAYGTMCIILTPLSMRENSRQGTNNPKYRAHLALVARLEQDGYMAMNGEKNLPKAEQIFRQVLKEEASSDDAWLALARIMDKQGRPREALTYYQGLLGPHAWVSSLQNDTAILTRYAELSERFGKIEQALQAYQKVLQVSARDGRAVGSDPNMPVGTNASDPGEICARAHILLGLTHQTHREGIFIPEREMPSLALQAFQEAVRLRPDLPIAHYYLGDQLRAMRRTKEADAEFARAESLGDDTFRAAMHKHENDAKHRVAELKKSERDVGFSYDGPGRPLKVTTRLLHPELNK